jgi:hypothetical protein
LNKRAVAWSSSKNTVDRAERFRPRLTETEGIEVEEKVSTVRARRCAASFRSPPEEERASLVAEIAAARWGKTEAEHAGPAPPNSQA